MQKRTVYLPAELKRALERTAQAQGRSEADLVRRGVEYVTGPAPLVDRLARARPVEAAAVRRVPRCHDHS